MLITDPACWDIRFLLKFFNRLTDVASGSDRARTARRDHIQKYLDTNRWVEVCWKAVQHGATLAKALGAKVTALTVSVPFHVFTLNTGMVEDTPTEYKKHVQEYTAKILGAVANNVTGRAIHRPF